MICNHVDSQADHHFPSSARTNEKPSIFAHKPGVDTNEPEKQLHDFVKKEKSDQRLLPSKVSLAL